MSNPVNASSTPFQPLAILVVDDVVELRDLVQLWLLNAGHSVTCASDGREVIRLLERQSFDLLITDIIMPDVDGLEVLNLIRKSPNAPRVLAVSGGGHHLVASDCLRLAASLGASATLRKPFNRAQL